MVTHGEDGDGDGTVIKEIGEGWSKLRGIRNVFMIKENSGVARITPCITTILFLIL